MAGGAYRVVTSTGADHPDFESEQAFLAHAAACLVDGSYLASRYARGGSDYADAGAVLAMAEAQRSALDTPWPVAIGRIDVAADPHYIGPRVVWEGSKAIVISWAADAARPFYTATPQDPADLTLRRRFRTDEARLVSIADEWFGAQPPLTEVPTTPGTDGGGARPGAVPSATIDDQLLDELNRQRTGSMEQVVATIQRHQYAVITRASDTPLVVQGGPGTGKTVVGLHRAALLLYRSREANRTSRILILGPNLVFMRYIRHVLPSLGESNSEQLSIEQLGGVRVKGSDDPRVAAVKGDPKMADVIRAGVKDRVRPQSQPLEFTIDGTRLSVSADKVAGLIGDFDPVTLPYNSARARFRDALESTVELEYFATRGSMPARARPNDPSPLSNHPDFVRHVDRIWPSISAEALVRQLLGSKDRLDRAAAGILSETDQRLLHRPRASDTEEIMWTKSDVALIDEARVMFEGRPERYWHVVLDEAQDLTPMELRMAGRRVIGRAATVLGDLAQATGSWTYESWDEVLSHLHLPGAEVVELRHAYRVPRQIMNVARPILEFTAPTIQPPEPYRDGRSEPMWVEVPLGQRAAKAVDLAAELSRTGGTTAIIAPLRLLDELRNELLLKGVASADAELEQLGSSVVLIDPGMAKGLEFDHVVVVEPAVLVRDHPNGRGLRELYVALTRPTQSLVCVHSERLPWPLGRTTTASTAPPTEQQAAASLARTVADPATAPAKPGAAKANRRRRRAGSGRRWDAANRDAERANSARRLTELRTGQVACVMPGCDHVGAPGTCPWHDLID